MKSQVYLFLAKIRGPYLVRSPVFGLIKQHHPKHPCSLVDVCGLWYKGAQLAHQHLANFQEVHEIHCPRWFTGENKEDFEVIEKPILSWKYLEEIGLGENTLENVQTSHGSL